MNRNVKRTCHSLLSKIVGQVDIEDPYLHHRSIYLNPEAYQSVQKSEVFQPLVLSRDVYIGMLTQNEQNYIYVIGCRACQPTVDLYEMVENVGMKIVLLDELSLPLWETVEEGKVRQFLYPPDSKGQIERVSFEDIKPIFKPIEIFEYKGSMDVSLEWIALQFTLTNPALLYLPFSEDCLSKFTTLLNASYATLNYDVVLRSLTASQWRYSFFDLYRCIESLFLFYRCHELKQELGPYTTLDYNKICKALYSKFSVFFIEQDILASLLSQTSVQTKNLLSSLMHCNSVSSFYALRNSIAHGSVRPGKMIIEIPTDEEWNQICFYSLSVIADLFDQYDALFETFTYRVINSH